MCEHISVILPNRPGELAQISDHLSRSQVNILGYALSSQGSFGIVHLLCDPHDVAFEVLRRAYRYYCSQKKILIVEARHVPGALSRILIHLSDRELNLENSYQGILAAERILIVLELKDREATEAAAALLSSQGFQVMQQQPTTFGGQVRITTQGQSV